MMSYDKSDIRFVLNIFENLLLVKKWKKLNLAKFFLGTNKSDLYQKNSSSSRLFFSNRTFTIQRHLIFSAIYSGGHMFMDNTVL